MADATVPSGAAAAAAEGVAVEKAAGSTKQQEAPKDTATAAPARLTDDELIVKHHPRYFYDKNEKHWPIDLNKYTLDQSAVPATNGVAAPSKDGKHTWLIYMSYFLYDGGVAKLKGKGGHKHDLEIVIVEIGNARQDVTGVFYGPHSSFEHMWIRNKNDVKSLMDDGARPKVYVSQGKHASYPISGKVKRLFGVGTDSCQNPRTKDRPLRILDERTQNVERIDGTFAGPKKRIARDWSVAPETRIKNVRRRRAVPPAAQVRKELSKIFKFK